MIFEYLAASQDVAVGAALFTTSFTTEAISPGDAWCNISIESDGNVYATDTTGNLYRWVWRTGQGTSADYQVRCDVNSGAIAGAFGNPTTFNSPVGTWLLCTSQRLWGIGRTTNTVGQDAASITLTIRSSLDGRTLTSGTISLTAKVV